MNVLVGFLIVIEVIMALLLVLLILLQRSKDEGLGMTFGNAMGESLFGAQAATILTKTTIWLAILFMLNTIVIDRLYSRTATRSSSGIMDRLSEPAPAPLQEPAPPMPAEETPAEAPAGSADQAPLTVPMTAPNPVAPATPSAPASPAAPVAPAAPAPAAPAASAPAAAPGA